jgi:hypothetical protein
MEHESLPALSARPPRRSPNTGGLAQAHVYRPGPLLAALVLVLPATVALVAAVICVAVWGNIPLFLPLVVLAWLCLLPATWLIMISVRTSSVGIAAARPWRKWSEIPWPLIERAEHRPLTIRLRASNGHRITAIPAILQDGRRLRREILMRLPMHVLDMHLQGEARDLLGESIIPTADGGLSGSLRAQPRAMWRWAAGLGIVGVAAIGSLAAITLPSPLGPAIAAVCALGVVAGCVALAWLGQEVVLSQEGISVVGPMRRRMGGLAWHEVQLIEHTPHERVLRLRGERRLRCPGPTMLLPAERDLMRAFLHEYCIGRGVPVIERRWLW